MIRSLLFSSLLFFAYANVRAQQFEPIDTLQLDNMARPVFEWIDVNNDGRLDMFITGENMSITDSSRSISRVYRQNADTTFTLMETDLETYGQQLLRLADLDKDGRQDLLIASFDGTRFEHAIYENNGDLTWNKTVINSGASLWEELRLADLDNDGDPEILTASNEGLAIYQLNEGSYEEIAIPEEMNGVLTDPVVLDFDKDGFLDILVAGEKIDGDSVALLFVNQQEMKFEVQPVESDSLQIADYVVSDFNDDGFPDVLLSRNVDTSSRALGLLINNQGETIIDSVDVDRLQLKNARVFAADLTSDGIVETDIEGTAPGASGVISRERVFRTSTDIDYERDTLENTSGEGRRYGDFDFDGDLDHFQVNTNLTGSRVVLFENIEDTLNEGPEGLEDLLSFRFQGDVYLVWNRASDDFTESRSVTYDVTLSTTDGGADIVAGGFDPVELRRTVVGPGNQGHNSFMIVKDAPAQFFVSIMPIDNAFHYDVSQCLQGERMPCNEEILAQEVQLCGENFVELRTETGEEARWFSVAGGYLGTSTALPLNVQGDDFIIAVYDRVGGCLDGEVFAIRFDSGLSTLPDQAICGGDEVSASIEGDWSSVQWSSSSQGALSTTNDLTYTPTQDDVITVSVTTERGCDFQQSFNVDVDVVIATVADSVVQIDEGESVRLSASGGSRYLWLPADGLSSNQVANPLASPEFTTEYTVFVISDNGCTDEQTVRVEVIPTAFAPDMFSPNGDGRNESFRVYDLTNVGNMVFSIFDRVGNKVFESEDLAEVTVTGWDGTKDGTEMPVGTYYWRVSGEYADGQTIKINGGNKGALQLIR